MKAYLGAAARLKKTSDAPSNKFLSFFFILCASVSLWLIFSWFLFRRDFIARWVEHVRVVVAAACEAQTPRHED